MKSMLLSYYGDQPSRQCAASRARPSTESTTPKEAKNRPLWELKPADMTTLRKIWEIGVQDVVAQTVIDLDGDTITYISRRYTAPSWGPHSGGPPLRASPRPSAIGTNLMQALQRFLTDLIALIGGGRRNL